MVLSLLSGNAQGSETESLLNGAVLISTKALSSNCTPYPEVCDTQWAIDSEFFYKFVKVVHDAVEPAFVITLAEDKEVQTVFIDAEK